MPTFKLPLSGTVFMSPIGSQVGWFNVNIGQSSEPAVEADVLSDVASYGKQLGRIGDALIVLLAHFHPRTPLTEEETAAIDDLKDMLKHIADVKDKHKRTALRPHVHRTADAPAPQPSSASEASQAPLSAANSSGPPSTTTARRSSRNSTRRPA
jgi:hypothetical protein